VILRIFKMAAAAILDFCNRELLLAIVPNFVKIGQSVVKILRFFDFSRWRPPPSWIFEIVNFYLLTVSGGTKRITVPNVVKIGRSIVEILQFFEFSRCLPLPFWIAQFYCFFEVQRVETHQRAIFRQNLSYEDINIFRFFILDFLGAY